MSGIPTQPGAGATRVQVCQSAKKAEFEKCNASAATLDDTKPLYSANDAQGGNPKKLFSDANSTTSYGGRDAGAAAAMPLGGLGGMSDVASGYAATIGQDIAGSTAINRAVTERKAQELWCQAHWSNQNTACKAANGDPALADALAEEVASLVQASQQSATTQKALKDIQDCAPALYEAQQSLKGVLASMMTEMPAKLGAAVPTTKPVAKGSYGQYALNEGDTKKLMGAWAGDSATKYLMNGSLSKATSEAIQNTGAPRYGEHSSGTDSTKFALQIYPAGRIDSEKWPVNYGVPLMGLCIILTKMTSGTALVAKGTTDALFNNPGDPTALNALRPSIAITQTTSADGTADWENPNAPVTGDSDEVMTKKGVGTLSALTTYSDSAFKGGEWVEDYNPQNLVKILNVAAGKLKAAIEVAGAPEKGTWLAGVMSQLGPLVDQMREKTDCLYDALDDLQKEEEKVEDAIAAAADKLGVDMDTADAQAVKAALTEELRSEGIMGDYFNKTKIIFKEQCWLLGYVDSITEYKKLILDNPIPTSADGTSFENGTAHKKLPYVPPGDPYSNDSIKAAGISNASLLIDGDPYGFLNQLVVNPSLHELMDASVADISTLQPSIKLYKVIYDDSGADAAEILVPFATSDDPHGSGIEDYLKNGRGAGVGIKSFNFVYDGSNPFAIKKSISANLKIFANNMGELLKTRKVQTRAGPSFVDNFRYTDLAMKTGKSIKSKKSADLHKENVDRASLNFRLRATVGWATPNGTASAINGNVRDAVKDSHVTLNLTPTVHNFEIDEQGRVIFNINYLAYIDEFFDQSAYDIFAGARYINGDAESSEMYVSTSRLMRKLRIETLNRTCAQQDVSERKEKDAEIVNQETTMSLSYLTTSLMKKDKIYYVNLPFEQVRTYNFHGPYKDYDRISKQIFDPSAGTSTVILQEGAQNSETAARVKAGIAALEKAMKAKGDVQNQDSVRENITAALIGTNINANTLSFFFLSDLVDCILENIDNELLEFPKELADLFTAASPTLEMSKYFIERDQIDEKTIEYNRFKRNFEKLRIVLGPAELFTRKGELNSAERLSVFVNLGDIPISVKYFMEFMTNKMLKHNKSSYPLTQFLNDLLNTLTRDFLNNGTCFGFPIKQKTRINQTAITAFDPGYNKAGIAAKDQEIFDKWDPITLKITNASQKSYPKAKDSGYIKRRAHRSELGHPILDVSGPSDSALTSVPVDQECNYFVYYAARVQPTELMNGIKSDDEPKGIFHYLLARDRGLIKNIKLTKTQTKGLAEVRFESSGYQGLEQLRVIYDVEIDCYANVATFPGTYLYVEPKGFIPQLATLMDEEGKPIDITKLGIGGYYMIIRSEHEFGAGYGNSRITAKWVHSIEHEAEEAEAASLSEAFGGSGAPRNPTCKYIRDSREKEASG